MGQKIHPIGMRLPLTRDWRSRWYADDKTYKTLLLQDLKLRDLIMTRLRNAGVSRVDIERSLNALAIRISVSKPGLVIGRGGSGLDELRNILEKQAGQKIKLDIEEVRRPDLNAYLVARGLADQIERRMPVKRIMNQAADRVTRAGAKGVKIMVSGRIGGAEISRREKVQTGSIPMSTLRANVDYAAVPAKTATAGVTGVKVWIYADREDRREGLGS
jgi:small subunit ribosomal protein S3